MITRLALAAGLASAMMMPASASATWSIVAVDPITREVGAAGASCILGAEVISIVVPGAGAAVAQAMTNPEAVGKLRSALAEGKPGETTLREVTSRWFDSFIGVPIFNLRQYGYASLTEPETSAQFTGDWTPGHAGSESAAGVSVQGNTLVGPEVLSRALAAFEAPGDGCAPRLADRLMAALAAGSEAGGDKRCAPELSALSAFLHVAAPEDPPETPGLALLEQRPGQPPWSLWQEIQNGIRPAPGTRDENPVLILWETYRSWAEDSGPGAACLPEMGPAGPVELRR